MRRLAVEHLIEDDSHGPDITFSGVGASVEYFRTHVHRTSHERLVDLIEFRPLLIVFGKTKIGNFVCLVLDEDVGGLEISMND
jgi:hypothetical protein